MKHSCAPIAFSLKVTKHADIQSTRNEHETIRLYILISAFALFRLIMSNVDTVIMAIFSQKSECNNSPAAITTKQASAVIGSENLLSAILFCALFILF